MDDTYDGFEHDDSLRGIHAEVETALDDEAETHGIDMDDDLPEGELDVEGEENENANDAEPHQTVHATALKPLNQSAAMLQQAEERRENDLNALNGQGCFNLVGGIIRQQIEDYLKLEKAGVCKDGRVIVDKMPRKVNEGMSIAEAKQTCHFLQDDGPLLEWINIMGVNVSPAQIRRKGGLNW